MTEEIDSCAICDEDLKSGENNSYLDETHRARFACNRCFSKLKAINADWAHLFSIGETRAVYEARIAEK